MPSKPQFVGKRVRLSELLIDTFSGEWGRGEGETLTPVLRTSNFNEDGSLNYSTPAMRCIPERKVVKKRMVRGDIILEKSGGTPKRPVGIMAFYDSDVLALCSNFNQVLRFDEVRILPRFAFHQLRWLKDRNAFDRYTRKTTGLQNLQMKKLIEMKLHVPQIEVQMSVATTLDEIVGNQRTLEREIAGFDSLVKSRFVEMFGDIDETPYEIRCIQDCSERIKDGTHQTPNYVEKSDGGVAFLSSKNVVGGTMDWDTIKYIPLDLHEKLQKRVAPRKGDVLLAKNGTTGVCAIVDRDCVFDIYVSLALIRPLEWMDSTYMWAAINAVKTKEQFDKRLKGIGVPNLHLGEIKQTLIVVPPLALQQEFAAFASQVNKSRFFFLGDERNEVLSILDVVAYVC